MTSLPPRSSQISPTNDYFKSLKQSLGTGFGLGIVTSKLKRSLHIIKGRINTASLFRTSTCILPLAAAGDLQLQKNECMIHHGPRVCGEKRRGFVSSYPMFFCKSRDLYQELAFPFRFQKYSTAPGENAHELKI